jgi:hypothetical protein
VTATPPPASLAERIAQAVPYCRDGCDDCEPAAVAAAVLAVVQPELDRIPILEERVSRLTAVLDSADDLPARLARQALAEEDRLRAELGVARAAGMREAAAMLRRFCPNHGDQTLATAFPACHCPAADEINRDANALAARTPTS